MDKIISALQGWLWMAMLGHTQYVSPLPRELSNLKARIFAAVKKIDAPMLMRVW
jgi:hypothetical protein